MVDVAANLRVIQERVAEAAGKSGRRVEDVTILGAAKKVDPDRINCALEAGLRAVGENYVQEAQEKIPLLQYPVSLHYIGHLQTNKARHVVELFDMVESVDSMRLARELGKRAGAVGKQIDVLLEVNLGGEESKSGVAPDQLIPLAEQMAPLDNLRVCGLMAMPPSFGDPEDSRPFFQQLRELADQLREANLPGIEPEELSMGMTHDYHVAVEEGAMIVRIGTGLFGPRD